ncbi:MAG TPA: S4 domain-containing protein [Longimicrobiaceae bacterium]|nr:S4 domain-containing protein [Longimicrobiaceae bacterium]
MSEPLRLDVLLHRLCITRSRSESKTACEAGAVTVGGASAKASQLIAPGQRIAIRFPWRDLEIELLQLPGKSVSKRAARELYRVLRDERTEREGV